VLASPPQKILNFRTFNYLFQSIGQIYSNIEQVSKYILVESYQHLNLLSQTQKTQEAVQNFENLINPQENKSSKSISRNKTINSFFAFSRSLQSTRSNEELVECFEDDF
jgi:hypothetical protein